MKICVLFEHFGPYHVARIRGAVSADANVSIFPLELFGNCETYAWNTPGHKSDVDVQIIFDGEHSQGVAKSEVRAAVCRHLDKMKPDVIAVHGWALPGAVATIRWACANDVAVVVMSESRSVDSRRKPFKEFLKKRVLEHVSAGLVGCQSHADYLTELGLTADSVFTGYNAVDNEYFATQVEDVRKRFASNSDGSPLPADFPETFFFASARFIEKKNLFRLIDAFANYLQKTPLPSPWGLVLAGDGPLKADLVGHVERLGLKESVYFPGFVQYENLPTYYGLASAFVHVSTVEQWGLVVNEAAAAGLPLVVSSSTGCVDSLVEHEGNGFVCDSLCTDSIAASLTRVAILGEQERGAMGARSQQIVSNFGPQQFGEGLIGAAKHALKNPRKSSLVGRWVVALLS